MRGSERTPVGKLNKRSFRYTRIWYTLWLVKFDRFCQHSSITDADEISDMAAVRNLSTSNRYGVQICYKQHAKSFPQVKCLREEQTDYIKIWSMKDPFAILPTGSWKRLIFQLFPLTSNSSDDGMQKPAPSSRDHGGLCSSRGHNKRPSWTVKHNRSRSNRKAYRLRSREELESARLCVTICK